MATTKTLGAMNPRPVSSMNSRPAPNANIGFSQPFKTGSQSYGGSPYKAPAQQSYSQQSSPRGYVNPNANHQNQTAQNNMTQPSSASSVADFVNVMRSMVGQFAFLNDDVIMQNIKLANGEGMSMEDRTISFECADYLMSNLAFVFMGLVLDKNFKQAFLDAVMVELQLDKKDPQEKSKIRASMKDNKTYQSNGSIVIGVTAFMPTIAADLMSRMTQSFTSLSSYADEFDAEVARLTSDQKMENGFIFSNFMYLIRAFTHNDMFMSYVITVIERVKEITVGKK